jgi:tRNA pseudouridine synthase 10
VEEAEERKGRGSIEEIVAFEIKAYCNASVVKLHACGREDIDVRCLGNGRPFALEIIHATKPLTPSILATITANINSHQHMNVEADIAIVGGSLQRVPRLIWEKMQTEAEEKKKGYACVVYVANGSVTRERLQALEARSRSGEDNDEDGVPCLQVSDASDVSL